MIINTELEYYNDYEDLKNFLTRSIVLPDDKLINSMQGCLARIGSYNAELSIKIQQIELVNDKLNKDILHLKKELENNIYSHKL